MAKGPIESGNAEMFQKQTEDAVETPRQRTLVEWEDLEGRNIRIKQEMADELLAMGFGRKMVERLLNIRIEKGPMGKKSENANR